jgi:hypothetical protein
MSWSPARPPWPVHDHLAVSLEPGDHPPDRRVPSDGLAGDGGRRRPAAGVVVRRARVGQRQQDQAFVAGALAPAVAPRAMPFDKVVHGTAGTTDWHAPSARRRRAPATASPT